MLPLWGDRGHRELFLMKDAYLFDTETTGKIIPHIVESALLKLVSVRSIDAAGPTTVQRFNPEKDIELSALAVHHIFREELSQEPSYTEFRLPEKGGYLIGFNVEYDWDAANNSQEQPEYKRIDLYGISRLLWPELDSHKQVAVYYHLVGIAGRDLVKYAHSAEADVRICLAILVEVVRMLQPESWEELWEFSEDAKVPETMPFGKHKGLHMSEVPSDYKEWLLGQNDVDPYLRTALKRKKWS